MHTLRHLAEIIKAELIGDPETVVRRARPFELAEDGDVTYASGPAYRARIHSCQASAIILAPPTIDSDQSLFITANPKLAFARAIQALHQGTYTPGGASSDLSVGEGTVLGDDITIHPRVTIGRSTIVGSRVTLHSGVVIGSGCRVGDDTLIYGNVTIYDDCEIGSRVRIHAGTVIGADGFGFVPDEQGRQVKLLQLGRVRIEDDCEIGANCAIDRGSFGDTVLRRGVKLDNLIQVGHNSDIGEDTVVAALTGFSGGTRVGRRCVIAGQVGTQQHIEIGDGAVIMGQAGVTKSVRAGALIGGLIPAQDYKEWRRRQALYSKLPEIAERLKKLERVIQERERRNEQQG